MVSFTGKSKRRKSRNKPQKRPKELTLQAEPVASPAPAAPTRGPGTLRLEEVFTKAGYPHYTYVPPIEHAELTVSFRNPKAPVIVEGPGGIGKTTLVRKVLADLNIPHVLKRCRIADDRGFVSNLPRTRLKGNVHTVVVDDFHALSTKVKNKIVAYVRGLADDDNPDKKIIILGINKAGQALIKLAGDMVLRIDRFTIGASTHEKIAQLLQRGAQHLNVTFADFDNMVAESYGSFHLAQWIGYHACIHQGITVAQSEPVVVKTTVAQIRDRILDDISLLWANRARTFARGLSPSRSSRKPYLYLLYWLSQSDDWSLDVKLALDRHPDHSHSINAIINEPNAPLERLLKDPSRDLEAFLHYDPVTHVLSIEDPKAFYYLKNINFDKFAAQCGFPDENFSSSRKKYDFALSFAGQDRAFAKMLFERLTARQLNVFYDENEQARLLGDNLEEYLRPIYESHAEYVIPLLSVSYPERIWTKFESDIFKTRFGEKRVLPVLVDGFKPSQFDRVYGIGHFSVKASVGLEAEADRLTSILVERLEQKPFHEDATV